MEKEITLYAVTNRGGKLLKPLNYFGYRVPIFFTKKEAIAAKNELDSKDKQAEVAKRDLGFERAVVKGTFIYEVNP